MQKQETQEVLEEIIVEKGIGVIRHGDLCLNANLNNSFTDVFDNLDYGAFPVGAVQADISIGAGHQNDRRQR